MADTKSLDALVDEELSESVAPTSEKPAQRDDLDVLMDEELDNESVEQEVDRLFSESRKGELSVFGVPVSDIPSIPNPFAYTVPGQLLGAAGVELGDKPLVEGRTIEQGLIGSNRAARDVLGLLMPESALRAIGGEAQPLESTTARVANVATRGAIEAASTMAPAAKVAELSKRAAPAAAHHLRFARPDRKSGGVINAARAFVGEQIDEVARLPVKTVGLDMAADAAGQVGALAAERMGADTGGQLLGHLVGSLLTTVPGLMDVANSGFLRRLTAKRTIERLEETGVRSMDDLRDLVKSADPMVEHARATLRASAGVQTDEELREAALDALHTEARMRNLGMDVEVSPTTAGRLGTGGPTILHDVTRYDPLVRGTASGQRAARMAELDRTFDPDIPDDLGAANVQSVIRARNAERIERLEARLNRASAALERALSVKSRDPEVAANASLNVVEEVAAIAREHGDEVTRLYQALPQDTKVAIRGLYDYVSGLDPKDLDVPADLVERIFAKSVIERRRGPTAHPENVIGPESGAIDPGQVYEVPMTTFGDLIKLERWVNARLRGKNTPPEHRPTLYQMRKWLEWTYDRIEDDFQEGGFAAAYREARQYAKDGYEVYRDVPTPIGQRTTAAGRILKGKTTDSPIDTALEAFLIPGDAGIAARMDFWNVIRRVEHGESASGAIPREVGRRRAQAMVDHFEDYLFARFWRQIRKPDGSIDLKAAREWRDTYAPILDGFRGPVPGSDEVDVTVFGTIGNKIDDVVSRKLRLDDAEGLLQTSNREWQQNSVSKLIEYAQPEVWVREALHRSDSLKKFDSLMRLIESSPRAQRYDAHMGLKRAILDDMRARATDEGGRLAKRPSELDPSSVVNYINQNRKVMDRVFGKRRVDKMLEWGELGRDSFQAAIPESTRARGDLPGLKDRIKNKWFLGRMAWQFGRRAAGMSDPSGDVMLAKNFIENYIHGRFPNVRGTDMIQHALLEPEFMELLAAPAPRTPAARELLRRRLTPHLNAIVRSGVRGGADYIQVSDGSKDDSPDLAERIEASTDRAIQQAQQERIDASLRAIQ